MSHVLPKPDIPQLRRFGWLMAGLIALFFGALLPWLWQATPSVWIWLVAGAFALFGLVWPAALGPVYGFWMRLGLVLGWINSRIILTVVYYAIVLPIGMIMRFAGKDPMARQLDEHMATYRKPSHRAPREHLEKPF